MYYFHAAVQADWEFHQVASSKPPQCEPARSREATWIEEMSESSCLGKGRGFHWALFLLRRVAPACGTEGLCVRAAADLPSSPRPLGPLRPRLQGHVLTVSVDLNEAVTRPNPEVSDEPRLVSTFLPFCSSRTVGGMFSSASRDPWKLRHLKFI